MWGDWAAKNMNHGADVFNWPPTCHLQLSPFLSYQNYKQFTLPDSFAANSGHVTQVWPTQCKDNCWARLPVRLFKRHAPLTYIRQLNFFFEKYQKYYMPGGYVSFDHLSNLAFYPPLLSCYQFDVPPSRPFQAPCTLTYVFVCVYVCMIFYIMLCPVLHKWSQTVIVILQLFFHSTIHCREISMPYLQNYFVLFARFIVFHSTDAPQFI